MQRGRPQHSLHPRKWARPGVLLPQDGKGCQAGPLPPTSLFPPLLSILFGFLGTGWGSTDFGRLGCVQSLTVPQPPDSCPFPQGREGQRAGPGTPAHTGLTASLSHSLLGCPAWMCRLHGDSIPGSPGSHFQAEGGVWGGRWVVLTQCSPAVNHKPLPPGHPQGSLTGKAAQAPSSSICPEMMSPPGSHRCQSHMLIPSVSSQDTRAESCP